MDNATQLNYFILGVQVLQLLPLLAIAKMLYNFGLWRGKVDTKIETHDVQIANLQRTF